MMEPQETTLELRLSDKSLALDGKEVRAVASDIEAECRRRGLSVTVFWDVQTQETVYLIRGPAKELECAVFSSVSHEQVNHRDAAQQMPPGDRE
jgi:hypothetical protein